MPNTLVYPQVEDVKACLTACNVELRIEEADRDEYIGRKLSAVIAEVEKRTHRTWEVFVGTRIYDGNGLDELLVDEMVSLTSVAVVTTDGNPSYDLSGVELVEDQAQAKTRLVFRSFGGLGIFPEGKQNIHVSGTFGYADEIPHDLWEAIAQETAFRLAQEVSYRPIGRIASIDTGTTKTQYRDDKPWMTGWHDAFKNALLRYRRRGGIRNARMNAPMI